MDADGKKGNHEDFRVYQINFSQGFGCATDSKCSATESARKQAAEFNQVSTSPATNPWGSQRDHTNETNALAQSEPDSRHFGEGERPTANLLGNGVKKTYIACTDPAYEPLVPTHEWVRRQNGWQYLEFASRHDAMVIRPEALTEVLFGCA